MKKRISVLLSVLLLACSGIAMAGIAAPSGSGSDRIDSAEMSLGGVRIGMTAEEVEEILGAPTERFETKIPAPTPNLLPRRGEAYIYGTSFRVDFEQGRVTGLGTWAREGIATPAGLEVGDTVEEMQRIYGAGQRSAWGNKDVFRYSSSPSHAGYRLFSMQVSAQDGVITYIGINETKVFG